MSLVTYPKQYKDEEVEWIESDTCYYSTAPQMSPLWDKLHIGCISSSRVNTWLGRSKFSEGPVESAKQCVGLSKKSFNSQQLDVMQIGIDGEPKVRDWYSKTMGIDIKEVGIAVWKEDPFFRSSLDGFYTDKNGDSHGIEIKISKEIYWPLVSYNNHKTQGKKQVTPNWDKDTRKAMHIWGSHYDQMITSIKVCGLKSIDYIVCGHIDNNVYIEKVYPDEERWENVIYPGTMELRRDYIEPLMIKHDISRLDPWMMGLPPPFPLQG